MPLTFLRRWRQRRRPPEFRIEPLESEPGFRLIGDLDVYSYQEARDALEPQLHGTLVLDLLEVEFMDDSGMGILVWIVKRLKEHDGSLVLRNPSAQIRRVLEMTGLDRIPGLTVEEAGSS